MCGQCQQQNPEDAKFCYQCGVKLGEAKDVSESTSEVTTAQPILSGEMLWRQFIGPNADYYLTTFKKFSSNDQPKFALSWNWPAFLPQISFLWFLYRKMYLHAFIYAVGPVVATYLTGDLSASIVWCIMAGVTGNYLYYWYCREHIAEIEKAVRIDPVAQVKALKESGGVQPYVIWVGVILFIISVVMITKMVQEGTLDMERIPAKPVKQTVRLTLP